MTAMKLVSPLQEGIMPDELKRVNAANVADEESPRCPATYRHDLTRSRIGRDGIPVRTRTILAAGLALAMLACTSEETPTDPSGSPSLARAGAATYTAVDLGTLGGAKSEAWAINPAGQVVGGSETAPGSFQNHAFLWQNGSMTDLGTLGGASSVATGINARGQVVGWSIPADGPNGHAFLWEKGVMTDLGRLGEDMDPSAAASINPAGQVVGESVLPGVNFTRHAFLFTKGAMADLSTLGGNTSVATGINPAGQVVGSSNVTAGGESHATLWTRK